MNTFHVALTVKDLPAAIEHYKKILGIEPAKVKADYAKFEIADPPVILSLNPGRGEPGTVSHLGIRHADSETVIAEQRRTQTEGIAVREQVGTTCCYAKADKYWVHDADGMQWEMYSLLADAEVHSLPAETACCASTRAQARQEQTTATESHASTAPVPVDMPLVQIQTTRSCC
jgi:catechol 2,3-dioxygenase-like lactoylglutathione lyase family enzyme